MKSLKYIAILFLTAGMFSCEEQLELTPFQSLSTSEALADLGGMRTAVNGAYDGLQGLNYYGRDFQVQADIETDLAYVSQSNSNRFILNYTYDFNADSEGGIYDDAYRVILRVNNVINNIDAIEGDQGTKDQLKGEALAIRALAHFDMVRLYGTAPTQGNPGSDLGVPIILEAAITEPARNTVSEVYTQVIADLNAAKSLLSDNGIYNFSPNAVEALLARVYLYQGDYSSAVTAASNVIGSGNYALASDLQAMFDAPGSSEEILTLRFTSAENRGSNNLGSIYNPDSYGDLRPSQDLADLYEAGDARANLIYLLDPSDATTVYHSKFLGQDGIPGLHSPKLLRLGEMHLIRIEANFESGNAPDALAELNVLRGARGASALASVDRQTILEERLRELAFEGHAKFDYFRMGFDIVRDQCLTSVQITSPCTIPASDPKAIYPIPQYEIFVNQQMVQNPGY
ncbi:MAG: RagB/SusD family nutrient uptake outer membrane protein [Saprospiraceae bacterium]|nr:RagB/SusD family nutrient uptake outer membrane protein [Saprospiraceae bacterium]